MIEMLRGTLVGLACLAACGDEKQAKPTAEQQPPTKPGACPATAPAPTPLPGVEPKHRTLAYWLERTTDLDEVLLDAKQIDDMNASLGVDRGGDWHGGYDLAAPIDQARLEKDMGERLKGLHDKLVAGEFVERDGKKVTDATAFDPAKAHALALTTELRVALDNVAIRCGPRAAGFFSKATAASPMNPRFDRNNCSTAHPQEVVQIIAPWPGGMRLARTRYATGWIAADAKLSPPIPEPLRDAWVHGSRVQADEDLALKATGGNARCPAGTLLPVIAKHVQFASATGFHETPLDDRVVPTRRPLTRRALLTEAFRFLDTPYGWGGGGSAGGHDCSAFTMDLFAAFDLQMPRHSGWQARAGTFSIDVSKVASLDERQRLIDASLRKGVVLLSFPGHVMLYLGRTDRGVPMVLHALAEYAVPCPVGGETLYQIDRIGVSGLDLGLGSSRHSLLERITTVTVVGKPPGVELAGAAELRPAAPVARPASKACHDSDDVAVFASPRVPNAKQAMRVIVTANRDPGIAELALFDPSGKRVTPKTLINLGGGPPWSIVAIVDAPNPGTWTAVLGDGSRVEACQRIAVEQRPPSTKGSRDPTAPAWDIQRTWGRATENLYATFVQRLFDFPPDQDLTWPNLHVLLRDPEHNILFDHLQRGEEKTLKLEPDCADLPYLLRSYFSWKMGLPFAYYTCSRGAANRKPSCAQPFDSNLMARDLLDDKLPDPIELAAATKAAKGAPPAIAETDGVEETAIDDVKAFAMFWGRHVSYAVHAASGRTVPEDEITDYYPVALTRESLRPGIVYHDPFGHVMVVSSWVPQSATSYGILLAADAQPDGTVGRKRFWRGNFLFSTETRVAGAGFKAFRPTIYDKPTKSLTRMSNKDLRRTRVFVPFSLQQYEGDVDTFYDTVETLVNPRPLDPFAAATALVDSLHSQASLRIISVKNGEDWVAAHPKDLVPMPDGADIFLTSGPWEDFATPSRDFRLLVAIDTVLAFPASVKRAPARFGLAPGPSLDAVAARLDKHIDAALRAKSIEYTRSDGKTQKVTLHDLVERRAGFEMSYNPNDCVEIRWAAPAGSPEMASCHRRAPADQQKKMTGARPWFHERKRPAR